MLEKGEAKTRPRRAEPRLLTSQPTDSADRTDTGAPKSTASLVLLQLQCSAGSRMSATSMQDVLGSFDLLRLPWGHRVFEPSNLIGFFFLSFSTVQRPLRCQQTPKPAVSQAAIHAKEMFSLSRFQDNYIPSAPHT